MNILAIKGSPRLQSNSHILLENALVGIKENNILIDQEIRIKTIMANNLDINYCKSCNYCYQNRQCIHQDDMVQLYRDFNQADIVLVSTPVFFNSIPAQLKTIIDRCQAIWASKYILNNSIINRKKKRVGFLFAAGGAAEYEEQFLAVHKVIEMFFRVINTEFKDELMITNVDKIPVTKREDVLGKAYNIGKDLLSDYY